MSSELIEFIKSTILIVSFSIFLISLNTISTLYTVPYEVGVAERFALKSHPLVSQERRNTLENNLQP